MNKSYCEAPQDLLDFSPVLLINCTEEAGQDDDSH